MAKFLSRKQPLLAVSWDQQQVIFVLAEVTGETVTIQAADSIPRPRGEDPPAPAADLLRERLKDHKLKHVKVLVGLARSQVEMLDLTLPPARDEELPELVRNQTLQQSSEMTDDSVIDFVTLDSDPTQPRHVSAAVAPADLLRQIDQQCAYAGRSPSCITLRPLSAASLCCRVVGPSEHKSLLVSRLDNEADFSIISHGQVVFSRTIRLASEPSEEAVAQQIISEINRSLLVAPQDSDAEEPVQRVYLLGSFAAEEETLEQLSDELELPVSLLNPLKGFRLDPVVRPESARHFAGLLGMIRDHVDGQHAINFADPKQPPPPPNYRRKFALYGAVAAVFAGAMFYHFFQRVSQAEQDVVELTGRLKEVEQLLETTNRQKAVVDAVARWQADDVNWLDELKDLSRRFPSGSDALVQRLSAVPASEGGIIDLQVQVRDPTVMTQMEDQFRDRFHQVRVKGAAQRSEEDTFGWQTDVTVYVRQRDKQQYAQQMTETNEETTAVEPTDDPLRVSRSEPLPERN